MPMARPRLEAEFIDMGESSKFQKSWTFEIQILKLALWLQIVNNFKFKWSTAQNWTENKLEKLLKPA